MTFKSLLNFGASGQNPTPALDRYHSGPSDYGHYEHGWSHGGHKGKGGGSSGAALSALTLLAFLFLINVMQQSLDNNNNNGTATGFFLREGEQPVAADARGDQASTKIVTDYSMSKNEYIPIKTSLQIVSDKN